LDGEMLTVRQVAELLQVCRDTVYAWCKRGVIEHVRIGNAVRIPRAALHSEPGVVARGRHENQ
jgi:excisionase family DNA binding protein